MHWLGGAGGGKAFDLKSILRPAYFVPETKTVRQLQKELMDKKVHIALVADEYGGTAGLVTIEDVVEEIFGDIKDEYEAPAVENPDVVLKLEQRMAEIDAAARVADVNAALSPLGVEIPDSEEYDTVGGFVGTHLGRIPSRGEKFEHETMEFTVLEAKPNRVLKLTLRVKDEMAKAEANEAGH
jgi:putative hemolysin